jgi:sugar lactone lactonase YvrE
MRRHAVRARDGSAGRRFASGRRRRIVLAPMLSLLVVVLAATGGQAEQARPVGDTRVFAPVPEPGQPAGIAVDGDRVLVSTAGVGQSSDPQLFVFDLATRKLLANHVIAVDHEHNSGNHPVMTHAGVAVDSARRVYVVDMNGRIVRIDPVTGTHEDYATFPGSVGGVSSMPFDIVFDKSGAAYVTDQNIAAIWRVPPGGGQGQLWFQDPRLAGYAFGPSGIRIDPSGKFLYFSLALSSFPATSGNGLIYRLPLADSPSPTDLQEVFRYPARSFPFGLAFGASGKLYVALAGPNQVSILGPGEGGSLKEERAFPSAEENTARDVPYEDPLGVAFDGCGSLLVTNSTSLTPPFNPARWAVLDAYVGDTAAPLFKPTIAGGAAPAADPHAGHGMASETTADLTCAGAQSTAKCLSGHLPLGSRSVGRVRVGDTRQRMLSWVKVQPAQLLHHVYRWCVQGSTGSVAAVFGKAGRARLVASTARGHEGRVRPGTSVRKFLRAYPRRHAVAPSLWTLAPGSNRIVGARHGKVRFVAVADRGLVRQPRLLARYLRRAGL